MTTTTNVFDTGDSIDHNEIRWGGRELSLRFFFAIQSGFTQIHLEILLGVDCFSGWRLCATWWKLIRSAISQIKVNYLLERSPIQYVSVILFVTAPHSNTWFARINYRIKFIASYILCSATHHYSAFFSNQKVRPFSLPGNAITVKSAAATRYCFCHAPLYLDMSLFLSPSTPLTLLRGRTTKTTSWV